jgi:hypothetical protein
MRFSPDIAADELVTPFRDLPNVGKKANKFDSRKL